MSLFKTRDFWTTTSEDDEYFDQNSIIITPLNGDSDCIITGSQSGVLRIFKPSSELTEDNNGLTGFNIGDVLLEKIFNFPILQIGSGKLVSGSQNIQIAVLHPRLLSVYYLTTKEGSTEYGTQYILQAMYEHSLKKLAFNFVIGPFGGSLNRDFICVQSLDGILSFFEQESFTFESIIPEFLLPGPLAYIQKTDSFVTISPNWKIENYSYKSLSENVGEKKSREIQIQCEWSYNLGECILDICVIDDFINKQTWIMVLGERNLYSINENGKIKFMKKLDYSPLCFNAYVLEDKLMSIIISDTNTLLIYQNTSLKWSAQLQFQAVAVKRAFFKHLKGAIVLLSEEGRLECSYLGTEPSLFVAPPLIMKEIDFNTAAEELNTLNKIIKNSYSNDVKINNSTSEHELLISISNPYLKPCIFETKSATLINSQMCCVMIDILPQAVFEEVQITLFVQEPLKAVPQVQFYTNLYERTSFECNLFVDQPLLEVGSLKMHVFASVISNIGVPRTFCKSAMLPLKLVMETCTALRESEHKITLSLNQQPVSIAALFPEFVGENSLTQASNAIGFRRIEEEGNDKVVTILLAKSSERYRIQSNSFTALNIIIEQIILRLKKHYANFNDFTIELGSALPSTELALFVKEHFQTRQIVNELQNELTQLTTQFRIIQKRLIAKFRAKNPTPLTNMELLLDDTYAEIIKVSDQLQIELNNQIQAQSNLSCALSVVTRLLDHINTNKSDSVIVNRNTMIKSALSSAIYDLEAQSWEDVVDGSLCYLLRTVLAKSDKDKLRAAQTSFDEVKDIAKVEKHLLQVLERISKKATLEISSDEFEPETFKNNELEETEEKSLLLGSQFGESSSRLLSAKRTLLQRRNLNS